MPLQEIPTSYFLYLGAFVFAIGLAITLSKKNAIMILIGIELMFNAANINLVAFAKNDATNIEGQILTIFVLVVAAAEAAIGLSLIIKINQYYKTIDLDKIVDNNAELQSLK